MSRSFSLARRASSALVALAVLLAACAAPASPSAATASAPTPAAPGPRPTFAPPAPVSDPRLATAHEHVDPALAAANVRFSVKLYRELARAAGQKNILVSPASVALALAMTYNGASGDTQRAMASALETGALSRDELNQAYDLLRLTLLKPAPDVELSIANSLWARQDVPFKSGFLARDRQYYGAEVTNLDFADPAAADVINGWVKQQTSGRIDGIVDPPIDPSTILFLINAIYFKAPWSQQFDAAATQDGAFRLANGQTRSVPMMTRSLDGEYYRGDGFELFSIPYGTYQDPNTPQPAGGPPYIPGRVSMLVFLPDEGKTLDSFYAGLDADGWTRWTAGLEPRNAVVSLPRFSYSYDVKLNDALTALGMGVAFDQGAADFADMLELAPGQRAFIAAVKHKAFIAVDERGTEAAAVTSVEIGLTSAPVDPLIFRVDRPFFYAIRDNVTGTILFMGAVSEP